MPLANSTLARSLRHDRFLANRYEFIIHSHFNVDTVSSETLRDSNLTLYAYIQISVVVSQFCGLKVICRNVSFYTHSLLEPCPVSRVQKYKTNYEGWNFNFGNAAVTFDTAHLQSSFFHRPSMYSPKLCRTSSQRWGSRMMPLAALVLLMVRTERSTAEGLNPPCNRPIR